MESASTEQPSLRLRPATERCVQCHRCDRACPMSLPVRDMVAREDMANNECLLCGSCVDNCPQKVIRYTWR